LKQKSNKYEDGSPKTEGRRRKNGKRKTEVQLDKIIPKKKKGSLKMEVFGSEIPEL